VCEERGVLVQPHHSHGCSCPVNLCKAAVLEQHLAVHHPEATRDGRGTGGASLCIAYVGDGGNDLCPAQKLLGPQDVLFVRAGYALDKLLKDAAVRASVSARVVVWTSGAEILAWLRANSSGQPEQASEAQPGPAE
jgi:pyridoxal phosphate phosphatase PHOSPHO2